MAWDAPFIAMDCLPPRPYSLIRMPIRAQEWEFIGAINGATTGQKTSCKKDMYPFGAILSGGSLKPTLTCLSSPFQN